MRNPNLHHKAEAFVKASINLLNKSASEETIPRITIDPYSKETKIDSSLFVFKHFKSIDKLPEFIDCAKYLRENPTTLEAISRRWKDKKGNIIPLEELRTKLPLEMDLFRDLHRLLSIIIQKNNGFVFSKAEFENVYEEFEKAIYSKRVYYRVYSQLEGFSGNFEELNLGNYFKIRKMSEIEKRQIINNFPTYAPIGILDNIRHNYLLETTVKQVKNRSTISIDVQNVFHDVISTLRLFKSGRLALRSISSEPISWVTHPAKTTGWLGSRADRIHPSSYELSNSEIISFLTVWRLFKKFRKKISASTDVNYFNIALKRFNYGLEETDIESKIIDFLIAFEALCLTESDELSYRLSNRIAILIAKNSSEAEEIRVFMKKAYDVRSKLVHGKKNKPMRLDGKTVDLKTISKKLEDYLRTTLKAYLKLSLFFKEQKAIISLLDKSLFDSQSKQMLYSKRGFFVNQDKL